MAYHRACSLMGRLALAAAALPCWLMAADTGNSSSTRTFDLQMADRLLVQNVTIARQLHEQRNYSQAVVLLDKILAAEKDYLFQPKSDVPLLTSLKAEAGRLLEQLPAEGRDAYSLQFGQAAERALAEAKRSGSLKDLEAAVSRYFHLQTGTEAAYLLAMRYRDRGDPFRAALLLERVQKHSHYAERLEPALSLELASCLARAGMTREAEEALGDLRRRLPKNEVRIAGDNRPLVSSVKKTEPGQLLQSISGVQNALPDDWRMHRGSAERNLAIEADEFLPGGAPIAPTTSNDKLRERMDLLAKQFKQQSVLALPSGHPLVVGDKILVRTASHLAALDPLDGRRLWETPLEDDLKSILQSYESNPNQFQSEGFSQALRRTFWANLTFGTLSSDGRNVFAIEGIPFDVQNISNLSSVSAATLRSMELQRLNNQKKYNLLRAYDVNTGGRKWEVGGISFSTRLSNHLFLAPPLPLGTHLFAVAENNNETRLLDLNPDSGAVRDQWMLLALTQAEADQPAGARVARGNARIMIRDPFQYATSPSYAEGVLVYSTGDGKYIALSLGAQTVQWVYRLPEPEPITVNSLNAPARGGFGGGGTITTTIAQPNIPTSAANEALNNRWADGSVTIAGGRALLTPPGVNELLCLDLHSGHLLWSAPRENGLYVGGVDGGNIVVVSRDSVRAVKLADGKSVWTLKISNVKISNVKPGWSSSFVASPSEALPSGRGLLCPNRYLLPLSSGVVVAIDLREGSVVSTYQATDDVTPGNLVACNDVVLSQNAVGLWSFDTRVARGQRLAAAIQEHPNDPGLLFEQARLFLRTKQLRQALDDLRQVMETQSTPQIRELLCAVLLEGLKTDFDYFAPLVEQFDAEIQQSGQGTIIHCQIAAGMQRTGRLLAAFRQFLGIMDSTSNPQELELFENWNQARRDRWISARLREIRDAAAGPDREEIERLMLARLRAYRPEDFLAYFGFHPSAVEVRMQLAQQWSEKQQWMKAERLLREVLSEEDGGQRHAATAQLAVLLHDAKQTADAAAVYDCLRGQLADIVCADGKTGRELYAALPLDDPVRLLLEEPAPWPQGKVNVENASRAAPSNPDPYSLFTNWQPATFPSRISAVLDARKDLVGYDPQGGAHWRWTLASKDPDWKISSPDGPNQVWPLGHLLILWIGNRVAAVDMLAQPPVVLWTRECVNRNISQSAATPAAQRMRNGEPLVLRASEPLPVAATPKAVCLYSAGALQALDPATGQVLWKRGDFNEENKVFNLFGDEEMLFVEPRGSNKAAVLSMIDGKDFGMRDVPELKVRLTTMGRRVVTWSVSSKIAQLTLVDPWTQETLWDCIFDSNARPWLIDGERVAVLDGQGQLAIVSLQTGATTLTAQLDRQPNLSGIIVYPAGDNYVLIANEPLAQGSPSAGNMSLIGRYLVNGRVYCVDGRNGGIAWSTRMYNRYIGIDQFSEVPVMAFFPLIAPSGRGGAPATVPNRPAMLCLDKRDGRVLYNYASVESAVNVFTVAVDPLKFTVEILSQGGSTKLTYVNQ
jgi:outer membrane protein assembly factor BamB